MTHHPTTGTLSKPQQEAVLYFGQHHQTGLAQPAVNPRTLGALERKSIVKWLPTATALTHLSEGRWFLTDQGHEAYQALTADTKVEPEPVTLEDSEFTATDEPTVAIPAIPYEPTGPTTHHLPVDSDRFGCGLAADLGTAADYAPDATCGHCLIFMDTEMKSVEPGAQVDAGKERQGAPSGTVDADHVRELHAALNDALVSYGDAMMFAALAGDREIHGSTGREWAHEASVQHGEVARLAAALRDMAVRA